MCSLLWQKPLKSLLSTCKDKATITKIHALMIITGVFTRGNSLARLIAAYTRINGIVTARHVFDRTPQRTADAWNTMIVAYSRNNNPNEVLGLYKNMIMEGIKPCISTFTIGIKASTSLRELKTGEEIWRKAVDFGYGYDLFVGSSVLNLYAKWGKMDEALIVFNKMPRKDMVCWTNLVTGFVQSGRPREAIDAFKRMQEEGMEGDEVFMLGLTQACASSGDLKLGLSIHGYMVRRDLPMDVVVQTSFVNMYAKNGHLELASRVFKKMSHKNALSWNALISGFAQNGFASNALELLVEMQDCGFIPDSASLVSALLACSQVGFLKLGKSVLGYIARRHNFDQVLGTAAIDMYSKCGALSCALAIFDRMDSRDLICWNTMIDGYGIHGHGKEALSVFFQMTKTDLKPDHSTFASLLSALGHSGLVEEGQYWFNLMDSEYKVNPSEKHYVCVVDLLARAGRVEEAYKLISAMDTEPGLAVWVSLLSGCQNHGKLLIGEKVAKKVLELNPDDLGVHALVSNLFAMGKNWNEVAFVRNIMKKTGLKKVPGYSVVEVNGDLHAFLMEDKSHFQFEDIVSMLKKLNHEMKAVEYTPKTKSFVQELVGEVNQKITV
ncbi:PPR domain-containing protein/PPR_2 domain-containing protein/PPR_3 domain-containing protein [Cephalotus follicularis]|uniref:PPR domain-containing protein/PPR_2 domain-containing protein/PPR_3 domain-containing protein n=1 Tax=Cephalotus follicularis TaxID=3775 RepID=A0A1Q3BRX2_CEPFO|nr:PPR domain-containing protein/PPR_2 domain-containing protein/PPR_3 domain-containing protein [Cephalotus follicularis]